MRFQAFIVCTPLRGNPENLAVARLIMVLTSAMNNYGCQRDPRWWLVLLRGIYTAGLAAGMLSALPLLLLKTLRVPGYAPWLCRRFLPPGREGSARLSRSVRPASSGGDKYPIIWLHALSVGETVAARTLLRALRQHYPSARLLLSSSTRAGADLARATCADLADLLLVMPSDLPWGAGRLARRLKPDLFILVETDFWPNLLSSLREQGAALLLVNGRMSSASWRHHRRWFFLSRPLIFAPFSHLAMQTEDEATRLGDLGVDPARISAPGNLKYPAALELLAPRDDEGRSPAVPANETVALVKKELDSGPRKIFWLAGSTHPGEEEILIRVFQRLLAQFPQLVLMLAPRRLERSAALMTAARQQGCTARRLSAGGPRGANLLVLDSYGCLAALYPLCDLAFIGGSLVPEGGHNPLEAAVWHRPVIFGPHMEDFAGIAADLLAVGAARQVKDEEELHAVVRGWLLAPSQRLEMGRRAGDLVVKQGEGVIAAHLDLVAKALATPPDSTGGRSSAVASKLTNMV